MVNNSDVKTPIILVISLNLTLTVNLSCKSDWLLEMCVLLGKITVAILITTPGLLLWSIEVVGYFVYLWRTAWFCHLVNVKIY